MSLQDKLIDYNILAKACKYYAKKGYTQIEVPWVVSQVVSKSTFAGTTDASFILTDGDYLVSSAEQGFVHMMKAGKLDMEKKYFAVSPCFRRDTLDETHSQWFMKLELFAEVKELRFGSHDLQTKIERDAINFFKAAGIDGGNGGGLFFDATGPCVDIMFCDNRVVDANGRRYELELGSYGVREIEGRIIVYGTGVALPRFSYALDIHNKLKHGR